MPGPHVEYDSTFFPGEIVNWRPLCTSALLSTLGPAIFLLQLTWAGSQNTHILSRLPPSRFYASNWVQSFTVDIHILSIGRRQHPCTYGIHSPWPYYQLNLHARVHTYSLHTRYLPRGRISGVNNLFTNTETTYEKRWSNPPLWRLCTALVSTSHGRGRILTSPSQAVEA